MWFAAGSQLKEIINHKEDLVSPCRFEIKPHYKCDPGHASSSALLESGRWIEGVAKNQISINVSRESRESERMRPEINGHYIWL